MTIADLLDRPQQAAGNSGTSAPRERIVDRFTTFDGTKLLYRAWLPTTQPTRPLALICLHRGHEHSARWQEFVEQLGLHDAAIFSYDARGHGRSPGLRGYAESFHTFVKDADAFVRFVSKQH